MIDTSAFAGIGRKPRLTSYLADAQTRGATHVMFSMGEVEAIANRIIELRDAGGIAGAITVDDPRLHAPLLPLDPDDITERIAALMERIDSLGSSPRSTIKLTGLADVY